MNNIDKNLNNLKNNEILNNLQASEKMKSEILKACRKNKRTSNVLFRYSKQVAAAITILIIGATGISAYAGITHIQRLSSMPEEEKQEYVQILETHDEGNGYSRNLSLDENNRMLTLLEEYRNGRFPENNISVVQKYEELIPDTLCYVEETGTLYLPSGELSDEQLLEYIDYQEKFFYVANEEISENAENYYNEQVKKSKSISVVYDMDADEFNEKVSQFIQSYLDITIDDSYDVIIEPCKDATDVSYIQKDGDRFLTFYISKDSCHDFPEGKSKVTFDNAKDLAEEYLIKYYDVKLPPTAEWSIGYDNGLVYNSGGYFHCQVFSDDIGTFIYNVMLDCETGNIFSIHQDGRGFYSESYSLEELYENIDTTLTIATDFISKYAPDCGELSSVYYRPLCNRFDSTAEYVCYACEFTNSYYSVWINVATNTVTDFSIYDTKENFDRVFEEDPRHEEYEYTKIK